MSQKVNNEQGSGYQGVIYQRGKSERLEAYRACLSSKLKGKRFPTKEERFKHFAISAKLCSGKAKDEKEAIKAVKEKHPSWFE